MKICVFSLRPVNPLYRTWGRAKGGRGGREGGERNEGGEGNEGGRREEEQVCRCYKLKLLCGPQNACCGTVDNTHYSSLSWKWYL